MNNVQDNDERDFKVDNSVVLIGAYIMLFVVQAFLGLCNCCKKVEKVCAIMFMKVRFEVFEAIWNE